jgi:hypothetical protein
MWKNEYVAYLHTLLFNYLHRLKKSLEDSNSALIEHVGYFADELQSNVVPSRSGRSDKFQSLQTQQVFAKTVCIIVNKSPTDGFYISKDFLSFKRKDRLTVSMLFRVFWDVARCSYVEVGRRFRDAYFFQHQDDDGGRTHV